MRSYNEAYTVSLCKLAINPDSKYKNAWINDIANFVYKLCTTEGITINNLFYRAFYDLLDTWAIMGVLHDMQEEILTNSLTDIEYFSITPELISKIAEYVYALQTYCRNLCKNKAMIENINITQEVEKLFKN